MRPLLYSWLPLSAMAAKNTNIKRPRFLTNVYHKLTKDGNLLTAIGQIAPNIATASSVRSLQCQCMAVQWQRQPGDFHNFNYLNLKDNNKCPFKIHNIVLRKISRTSKDEGLSVHKKQHTLIKNTPSAMYTKPQLTDELA